MDISTILVTLVPIIGLILLVSSIAFWVWMLVDAIKRDFESSNMKIVWLLVVLLGQLIGAVIYYFVVKRD